MSEDDGDRPPPEDAPDLTPPEGVVDLDAQRDDTAADDRDSAPVDSQADAQGATASGPAGDGFDGPYEPFAKGTFPGDAVQEELARWSVEPTEQTSLTQLLLDFTLFLALFVTPWLISLELKEVFNTSKNAFIGYVAICMALIYVVDASGKREIIVPRLRTIPYLLLLLGWMAISLLWGGSFDLAVRDFGYHAAIYTIFLVTIISVWDRDRMENLLHFAIAAGVIAAGFATLQYYGLDEKVFNTLSTALFSEDTTHLDPVTGHPVHGGLLSVFFSYDTARSIFQFLDPRVLILPGKPEEPSKNYSFMGHRNYLAGYLIALIPLILSRLLAHVDVLLKTIDAGAARRARLAEEPFDAQARPGQIGAAGGELGIFSEQQWVFVLAAGALVIATWLAAAIVHRLWPMAVLASGGWLLCIALMSAQLRSVIVYLASLLLLFTTVVQTHTRGSWIGLAVALPFFYFTLYIKETELRKADLFILINNIVLVIIACLVKVLVRHWVSWVVLFGALGGFILYYGYIAFRPRYLHRKAMLITILPFILAFGALNWKSVYIPGVGTVQNKLNKEWTSALERLDDTFRFGEATSTHQRMLIYRTTFKIIFDSVQHVLIGTGIGTFGLHYMPYQARVVDDPAWKDYITEVNKSIYAHDEYIHYWSEIGLVGLILFLAVTAATLIACQRSLWACPVNYENLLFMGILSSLVAVMGHILFSFCLHLAYTAALFYVLVAFAMRFFPCPLRRIGLNPEVAQAGKAGPFDFHLTLRRTGDGFVRAVVRIAAPAERDFKESAPLILQLADPTGKRHDIKGPRPPQASLAVGVAGSGSDDSPDLLSSIGRLLAGPDTASVLVSDLTLEAPEMDGTWTARLLHAGTPLATPSLEVRHPGRNLQILCCALGVAIASVLCIKVSEVLVSEHNWRNGFMKFRQGHFVDSFQDFVKAMQHDPGKGEIYFDFGRALMDSGRNKVAIEVFERATENFIDPANYHNIALCCYKEHDLDRAELNYRKALNLNLIYEQSLSNMAFLLLDKEKPAAEMKPILEEAGKLAFLGVRYYRQNTTFWTALGVVRAKQERFDEALVYLMGSLAQSLVDKARRVLGDLTVGDRELRLLQYVRGLTDKDPTAQKAALTRMPGTLGLAPDEGEKLTAKASAELALIASEDSRAGRQERIQRLDERIKALEARSGAQATGVARDLAGYTKIVEAVTDKLHKGMGASMIPEPRVKEALEDFLQVEQALDRIPEVELDQAADKVRLNVATIWQGRGDTAEALLLVSRVVTRDDPAARARYLSIVTSHYQALLKPKPDDQGLLYDLAHDFEAWDFHSEAAKTLYRLLDVAPQHADAMALLGECLYKQHYVDQAIKQLEKALVILPAADPRAQQVRDRLSVIQAERAHEQSHPTTR